MLSFSRGLKEPIQLGFIQVLEHPFLVICIYHVGAKLF